MLGFRLKTILLRLTIVLSLLTTLAIGLSAHAFFELEQEMLDKLEFKSFLTPTEIYAAPYTLESGSNVSWNEVIQLLKANNYRERSADFVLLPRDFRSLSAEECQTNWSLKAEYCIELKTPQKTDALFVFKTKDALTQIYDNQQKASFFQFPEQLIAQYLDGSPILHEIATLDQIPLHCSNAVMAIEDQQFLEHKGISVKGIFRAISRNIVSGRKAQGASTITQQLIKNYFLTSEKTYSRKAREITMSLMLESRFTKDQILEAYLNVIYMGQSGAYQVKGFKAAAKHYFAKDINALNLAECSLLAAIVNSPGIYNPFKNSDKALTRRNLVLSKMLELKLINPSEKLTADKALLPSKLPTLAVETAPYYIEAVKKQVQTMGIQWDGLRIETGLNLQAQNWAQQALLNKLEILESENSLIKKNKLAGLLLQGVVLSGNPKTGLVEVVVGGRDFKKTQFNRATDAQRQVGSIIKPFVYLTAFHNGHSPNSIIEDSSFKYTWENQSWSPTNYDNKYHGMVSLNEALKQSLNIPTAKLGIEVGLEKIVETVKLFGLESPMKPVPALTLGAFEMSLLEVLRAYMGLNNMGDIPKTSFIRKISSRDGTVIWTFTPEFRSYEDKAAVAETVGVLKNAVTSGTGAGINKSGFQWPSAGKTGTTSDYKDAWFVGFTRNITSLVWLGYDNNTPHKLTGASGPLSIWLEFMNKKMAPYKAQDFEWPKDVEPKVEADQTLILRK